jgi:hypothetical protein
MFTADPENIKAILTTQFADYGKSSIPVRLCGTAGVLLYYL